MLVIKRDPSASGQRRSRAPAQACVVIIVLKRKRTSSILIYEGDTAYYSPPMMPLHYNVLSSYLCKARELHPPKNARGARSTFGTLSYLTVVVSWTDFAAKQGDGRRGFARTIRFDFRLWH